MNTFLKLLITLFLLFLLIIIGDAFYSAVFIGNQLRFASIASTGFTVLVYAGAAAFVIYGILILWKKTK
jgi:predicted branched-subunit amino acid permease